MWIFGAGAIGLVLFALWLFCVIDVITTDESDCKHIPKMLWLVIVLLVPTIGSIVWLVLGRERSGFRSARQEITSSGRFPEYERPGRHIAARPDDDEEFLRRCRERAEEQRRAARELRRKREQEEQDGAS